MNTVDNLDILERKILELCILTNANWKNQKYELAVMGEKLLRSLNMAKAFSENSSTILEKLPQSINELRDASKLVEILEAQASESLKN